jgi:thiamine transporter ThiT
MSQNTVAITLRTDFVVLDYFAVGDDGCFHIMEFHFVSGVMWWTHFHPVTISQKAGSFGYAAGCLRTLPFVELYGVQSVP